MLNTLGGDGEVALLAHCVGWFEESAAGGCWDAEFINVDGEDVGLEEEAGGVGVGGGDGEGVDGIEGGVDWDSRTGGVAGFGEEELSDTVDGVTGVREVVVVLIIGNTGSPADCDWCVEGGDGGEDVARGINQGWSGWVSTASGSVI